MLNVVFMYLFYLKFYLKYGQAEYSRIREGESEHFEISKLDSEGVSLAISPRGIGLQ